MCSSDLSYVAPTDNLRAGFILSPFVATAEEIEALYTGAASLHQSNDVITVKISERKNDFPWHILSDHYKIELFSLEEKN